MKFKNLVLLVLILISGVSLAQENKGYKQTIRGTVIEKITQMPLSGATVVIRESNPVIGTITDLDGNFKLENIDVGHYSIYISFIGFEPIILSDILVTTGKETILKIDLIEQAFALETVVIKANQRQDEVTNKMASVSARSFTPLETERYAGSLGDPSRMVANYAGVSMVDDSRNDIIIRGNSPIGLLWRVDDVEIPNPNHFSATGTTGGPVSMINNNLLSKSDFFTSAFPAQYGNAMSGVFDLKMRSGNNEKREYVGQIGFNGLEFGAEGPFKKGKSGSYIINYRYSTIALMSKLGFNAGTGDAIPYYQDLSFKFNFPETKIGKISLFGIGGLSNIAIYDSLNTENDDDDQNYTGKGTDLDFISNMGVLGLSNIYNINESTSIKTILSAQATKGGTQLDTLGFDTDGTILPDSKYRYYTSDSKEIKYSASIHLNKKINKRNNYVIGAYYDLYKIKFIDSVFKNTPDFIGYEKNIDVNGQIPIIRGYAQWQHRFSNKLTLNTGLYSQYVQINKEATLEPRLGVKYKISEKQIISAGYGMHSQMQPRLYYFKQKRLPDGSYVLTNKDLKLSKSHQFVLSYDVLFKKHFRFKTELYYQHLYHIPVTHINTAFSMINVGTGFSGYAADSDYLVNLGSGENYGIEFTLEKFLSNNFYMLSTISLFESLYNGYDNIQRNSAFNNNYIVNVLGGYEKKVTKYGYLSLDLRMTYAGGKRYIPIDMEASKLAGETVYDWDTAFENKYNDYFRTDVKLSYKLNWKHLNHEWAINFQNITNKKNIFSEQYNSSTQEIQKRYQLGFYPAFLYRIVF